MSKREPVFSTMPVPSAKPGRALNWFAYVVVAVALAVGLTYCAMPAHAQTQAQTTAQVKLLTARMTDQINQLNKLTTESADLKAQVFLLTTEAESTRVWLTDLRCKWNRLLTDLASKEAIAKLYGAVPPVTVIYGKNCALDGPAPQLRQVELPTWPIL